MIKTLLPVTRNYWKSVSEIWEKSKLIFLFKVNKPNTLALSKKLFTFGFHKNSKTLEINKKKKIKILVNSENSLEFRVKSDLNLDDYNKLLLQCRHIIVWWCIHINKKKIRKHLLLSSNNKNLTNDNNFTITLSILSASTIPVCLDWSKIII